MSSLLAMLFVQQGYMYEDKDVQHPGPNSMCISSPLSSLTATPLHPISPIPPSPSHPRDDSFHHKDLVPSFMTLSRVYMTWLL